MILAFIVGFTLGLISYSFYLHLTMDKILNKYKEKAELMLDCVYETKKARDKK